ncbi:hypothetical protein [Jeotgalibaca porci]|uniref:YkvI family membrane protein n=1 Tax=Jeotgalibaca porci TaxID=1868793 RepID=UPI00359F90EA
MEKEMRLEQSTSKSAVRPRTVWRISGAIIAFLIGSGFASGQEIFQFFTVYGYKGIMGSIIATVIFCLVSGILVNYGYSHLKNQDRKTNNPYTYYLGKYFGKFMQWYTPFFAFLINIVMISGAGATMNQYFGLDSRVGTVLMTIFVTATALLGLSKLIDIISLLGPLTVVFSLLIAILTLVQNPGNFLQAEQAIQATENVPFGAGNNMAFWLLGGILFVAYNIVAGVPFITNLGLEVQNKKEAWVSGIMGGVGLMSGALLLNVAMLGHVDTLVNVEVPVLYLAQQISPVLGLIFAFILLEEIFSTSAPMLWTVVDSVTKQDTKKSVKQGILIAVSLLSLIGAQLPFGTLVGIVYPFTGYFGIVMLVLFIGREVWENRKQRAVEEGD